MLRRNNKDAGFEEGQALKNHSLCSNLVEVFEEGICASFAHDRVDNIVIRYKKNA